jgi:hypothetical protein
MCTTTLWNTKFTMSQLILIEGLDEEDWIKSMYIQYIIHSLFTATRLHVFDSRHITKQKKNLKKMWFSTTKWKDYYASIAQKMKKKLFWNGFSTKKI